MNKKGLIAEKWGYYFIFILLFSFAFLYGISFLKISEAEFDVETLEDSIVATRILNCFSDDNFLLDENKMNSNELRRCFSNDKYFLEIKLGDIIVKNVEELHFPRDVKRYVKLKDNKGGILEIKYVKNVA